MTPLLEVRNLYKTYDGVEVLRGLGFTVDKEEFFVIIGPNGAGKTTILRILDLLDYPDRGEVFFNGISSTQYARVKYVLRRMMAVVFQRTRLFDMSVFDNIAYGLRIRGVREADVHRMVERTLSLVKLRGFEKRNALTLSGGETQRVALAQALAIETELLLLDEPTANLDPASASLIEKVVASINREKGVTVILTTHNLFQARRLANRVAFLLNGEIVEVGATKDFFAKPQDARTKAFLEGKMVF